MASPANVATPLIGLAVVVPRIVALVGFVPSAILIGSVALVSGVPEAVWTITCTAGEVGVPAIGAVGWVTKTSRGARATAPARAGARSPGHTGDRADSSMLGYLAGCWGWR